MLVLAKFRQLLSQVLSSPDIHTIVLSTPAGNVVSFVSLNEVTSTKTEIRLIVGLSGEIWAETSDKENGVGMAEDQQGKILVQPVFGKPPDPDPNPSPSDESASGETSRLEPILLLSIATNPNVEWNEVVARAAGLAKQLTVALGEYGDKLLKDPPLEPPPRIERRSPRLF